MTICYQINYIFFNENRSKFINLFFRPRHHEGRAPERNHRLAQSVQLRATAVAGDDEHGRVRRKVGVRSSKNNPVSRASFVVRQVPSCAGKSRFDHHHASHLERVARCRADLERPMCCSCAWRVTGLSCRGTVVLLSNNAIKSA